MIKKVKKVGNSNAVILDKPLLELVGLAEGGEVKIVVRDGSIILTPVMPRVVAPKDFDAALERVVGVRRDALEKLSK